jgi:hypothetical protein
MAINEEKVIRMVDNLEMLRFFSGLNRLPKEFYTTLNDEEKAEVIRRYRRRNHLDKPPDYETK